MLSRALSVVLPVLVLVVPVRAEMVQNLYTATVPVADRSTAALDSAASEAMAEVLVKVSGNEEVLGNPTLVGALRNARDLVQYYGFADGNDPEQLYAHFDFYGAQINDLVTGAGAPLWTANRPRALVWLVLEDEQGRRFVSGENTPALARDLLAEFNRRGVPAQLPLHDLADSAAITLEEVWRLYTPALQRATERYRLQDVVAGRVAILSTGNWVGEWSYLHSGKRSDRAVNAAGGNEFFRQGAALVAQQMSARYAVAPGGGDGSGVTVLVRGVNHYADYAAIIAWLEKLEVVESANVERIEDDAVQLRVMGKIDAPQLSALIALNRRLSPQHTVDSYSQLNYQWQ